MPLTQEETERYARHLSLPELGEQGQQQLKRAHVALVGLGGLGSPVALYLAAAGVGRLTLVDPDDVTLSNLQRQILYATENSGAPKAAGAATRLAALNPAVEITAIRERLTPANAAALLAGCGLAVDASDNYAARFAMADAAAELRIPMVHGAVQGFTGQVAVFAPHKGTCCYRCLFPENAPMEEEDSASGAGILGAHAGITGCLQALETLKLLAGIPSSLMGSLLSLDTLRMRFTTIPLQPNPACKCRKRQEEGAAMKN